MIRTRFRQIQQNFENACREVNSILGEKPFHLRQRLNLAALDAVMASAIELSESVSPKLRIAYNTLRSNEEFMEAVTHNTSDASALQRRFTLTHNALNS